MGTKSLYETFSLAEFAKLTKAKEKADMNWHDFIMQLAKDPEASE